MFAKGVTTIRLRTAAVGISLITDEGRPSPWWAGPSSGLLVLGSVREQAEQARGGHTLRLLHELLPRGSRPDFL